MANEAANFSISARRLKSIYDNPEKCAALARLLYVSDSRPGIRRVKRRGKFSYLYNNKVVKDKEALHRIRRLVIPPAWEDVWICPYENGHLQATGTDAKKRKQYKYHPHWNSLRSQSKFYRLHEFGRMLPAMRRRISRDLCLPGLPLKKILSAVVSIMESTSIRVGNNLYERLYGTFGLTTLKDRHVKIRGEEVRFVFTGKKGIPHNISIRGKRLAAIVRQCRDIPGRELFQYYDNDGQRRVIDSGLVNDYIREISHADFTAKDFRTWAGTVQAIRCCAGSMSDEAFCPPDKLVVKVLDRVAAFLGNSRSICRKYYVHPAVLTLIVSGRLKKYLGRLRGVRGSGEQDLDHIEKTLMNILEKERLAA